MKNINDLDLTNCIGCKNCASSCATKAIAYKENAKGFLYPVVDNERCIKCGACLKTCPIISSSHHYEIKNAFCAINSDKIIQNNSSSAGVFYLIAKWFLLRGGLVVGAAWKENFTVEHILIDRMEDLAKLQKSKYVQSEVSIVFSEIKSALDKDIAVLFSGTPCQIVALHLFLNKDYHNLFCIDVVCHGVPSSKQLLKYISYIQNRRRIIVERIDFRHKFLDRAQYITKIDYRKNNSNHVKSMYYDWRGTPYMYLFMKGYSLRDSCYSCQYASCKRVGDLSLGDFWGVKKVLPLLDDSNGVSLILVNSEKGIRLYNAVSKDMVVGNANKWKRDRESQEVSPFLTGRETGNKWNTCGGVFFSPAENH